jgi:lipopolysaccharide/colanic/teichoic acid biosynthesis glycosyltransferase
VRLTAAAALQGSMSTDDPIPPVTPAPEDVPKRLLDLVVAGGGLVVIAPLLAIVAVLVKLSSPGPVFFTQERVGRGGRLFRLYKFRSMRPDSGGPSVTSGGDARITPVGRFLRKWKLDELPQLINVVKGEMSLVGPRPEVPRYVRHYSEEQRQVLSVRPGITGATQIEFRNEEELLAGRDDVERFYLETVMPAKLAIDLRYVRSRSLMGDIALVFRTLLALRHRGTPESSEQA